MTMGITLEVYSTVGMGMPKKSRPSTPLMELLTRTAPRNAPMIGSILSLLAMV